MSVVIATPANVPKTPKSEDCLRRLDVSQVIYLMMLFYIVNRFGSCVKQFTI